MESNCGYRRASGSILSRSWRRSHCAREPRRQRLAARVGEHAARLLLESGGRRERAVLGGREQLVVGARAPEEERQPRRQVDAADRVRLSRLRRGGRFLEAEDEVRAGQHRLQRGADPGFESVLRPLGLVEREQPVEVGSDRAAGDTPRSRVSARILVAQGISSAADSGRQENTRRRLGVSETPVTVWGPRIANSRRCGSVVTPETPLPICVSARVCSTGASRSSNGASDWTRNAAETRCGPAFTRNGRRLQVHAVRIRLAHARVDLDDGLPFAVDRQLDLLALDAAAEQLAGRDRVQHHPERILAVGREIVDDRDAAARPERRAVDVLQLRRQPRDLVDRRAGRGAGITDRQAAHLRGRPQITFEQGRRHRLHVGDVVEVVADRVGGQQRRHVDVEIEDVLDLLRVLRAVQALERPVTGIGLRLGGRVERRLEGRGQRSQRSVGGTIGAGGRHHAGPQLADHLLGHLAMLGGLRGIEGLEGEITLRMIGVVALQAVVFDDRARLLSRQDRRSGRMRRDRSHRGCRDDRRRSGRKKDPRRQSGDANQGYGRSLHPVSAPRVPEASESIRFSRGKRLHEMRPGRIAALSSKSFPKLNIAARLTRQLGAGEEPLNLPDGVVHLHLEFMPAQLGRRRSRVAGNPVVHPGTLSPPPADRVARRRWESESFRTQPLSPPRYSISDVSMIDAWPPVGRSFDFR